MTSAVASLNIAIQGVGLHRQYIETKNTRQSLVNIYTFALKNLIPKGEKKDEGEEENGIGDDMLKQILALIFFNIDKYTVE